MRTDALRIAPVDLDRLDNDQQVALTPFLATNDGGLAAGLTEDEIERIKAGPDAEEWSARDASNPATPSAMAAPSR